MARPPCVILAEEVWGSTLHAARQVAAVGAPALVATAGRGRRIYGRSRHCLSAEDFPSTYGAEFLQAVGTWARCHPLGAGPIPVIPTSDRLACWLAQHASELGPQFVPIVASSDALERSMLKDRSCKVAQGVGIDVPPWHLVTDEGSAAAVVDLPLPVIVRPNDWSAAQRMPEKFVVARSAEQLRQACEPAVDRGVPLLVQQKIDADDENFEFSLFWRSSDRRQTLICTGRKRRQASPDGGVMVWGETTLNPLMLEETNRFLDASGVVGLGGLEMISTGGRRWFVECNARLEAIHFLAARAGMPLVQAAYLDAVGESVTAMTQSPEAVAGWVGSAWLHMVRQGGSRRSAMWDKVQFMRNSTRVRAIWSWSDPLPGVVYSATLARGMMRSARA